MVGRVYPFTLGKADDVLLVVRELSLVLKGYAHFPVPEELHGFNLGGLGLPFPSLAVPQ